MKIRVYNSLQEYQFDTSIDTDPHPESVVKPDNQTLLLNWAKALDTHGQLKGCPICQGRELFKRKDFPQRFGITLVIIAGILSTVFFAMDMLLYVYGTLGLMVLIDLPIYLMTKQCIVCYKCRSEFRDTPINPEIEGWDLAIGEKYRILPS